MAEKTVINTAVNSSTPTVINNNIVEEYNRQNNIDVEEYSSITEGTMICDKYKVRSEERRVGKEC